MDRGKSSLIRFVLLLHLKTSSAFILHKKIYPRRSSIVNEAIRKSDERALLKARLLETIVQNRRGNVRISDVLTAAEALEAQSSQGEVTGRWSLIFSTLLSGRADADDNIFQAASNRIYETLFRVAPVFAGGSESGFKARNEQLIQDGLVDNLVNINDALSIRVSGSAKEQDVASFDITFDKCQVALFDFPSITIPLPRPRGKIITSYVDDDLRLSRGSRGGLFILKNKILT